MPKKYLIYTVALFCLFSAHLGWWHLQDTRPPAWDASVHLTLAGIYKDYLYLHKPMLSPWVSFYPPFYHLSLIPSLSFGQMSEAHAVATHAFYFGFMLLGFCLLAQAAQVEVEAAFLATLLLVSCNLVVSLSLHTLIDFSLLSWVVLGMGLLAVSDHFKRRRMALLWGVVMGCGQLIKPAYFLFFGLPCLYSLLQIRNDRTNLQQNARRNFLLSIGTALVISVPWYYWQGATFFQFLLGQVGEQGVAHNDPTFHTLAGWWWNIHIMGRQMGWPCLALTLIGLALAFIPRRKNHLLPFLSVWWLSGYIAVSLVHNKDPRYGLPCAAALVFIAGLGWVGIVRKIWLKNLMLSGAVGLFIWNCLYVDPPLKEDWQHAAIGERIATTRDTAQPFPTLSVLSNHPMFFGRNIRWTLHCLGKDVEPSSPGDSTADFTEYILTKSGDPGPDAGQVLGEWDRLNKSGRAFKELYLPIAQFPLPDKSTAVLYRRDPLHAFAVPVTLRSLKGKLTQILGKLVNGPLDVELLAPIDHLRRGHIDYVEIKGGPWMIRGIPVAHADVFVDNAWINLYRVWDEQAIGLLAAKNLHAHIEVDGNALQAALQSKIKGISDFKIQFADQGALATARWRHIPLQLSVGLSLREGPSRLVAILREIKIMHLPVPALILGKLHAYQVPLTPISTFPVTLEIHKIETEHNTLKIS